MRGRPYAPVAMNEQTATHLHVPVHALEHANGNVCIAAVRESLQLA